MNGKLVLFPNAEKIAHERWFPGRHIASIPQPFRAAFISPPNAGKTCTILNMFLHNRFDRVYLYHPDTVRDTNEDSSDDEENSEPERVKEYMHLDYIPITDVSILQASLFDPKLKNCLVCDDVHLKDLNKTDKRALIRMFSYVSTHRNVSIMISSQDPANQLSVSILRFCNFVCLWKYDDTFFMRLMLSKIGFEGERTKQILKKYENFNKHDFLTFDRTDNTPYPVRKNLTEPITL